MWLNLLPLPSPLSFSPSPHSSNDAGKTIKNQNKKFHRKMRKAMKRLNLKSHYCGLSASHQIKLLYSPVDLEGHLGEDKKVKLYLYKIIMKI